MYPVQMQTAWILMRRQVTWCLIRIKSCFTLGQHFHKLCGALKQWEKKLTNLFGRLRVDIVFNLYILFFFYREQEVICCWDYLQQWRKEAYLDFDILGLVQLFCYFSLAIFDSTNLFKACVSLEAFAIFEQCFYAVSWFTYRLYLQAKYRRLYSCLQLL